MGINYLVCALSMGEFIKYLIGVVSKYYNRPYRDNNEGCTLRRTISSIDYKVYRYNHGLLYGIRQALLAKSIIYLNYNTDNDFGKWIRHNCKNDRNFIFKVMFASAFQRTGRESEGSSQDLGDTYLKYELNDTKYFEYEARKTNMFCDCEINTYKSAIIWETDKKSYLKNILHAAHLLDLRRIPSFDSERIRREVAKILFGSDKTNRIVETLFDISGIFIDATGDRDMMKEKNHVDDRFFILSNNDRLLGNVMDNTFEKISTKLFKI
jgi:SidE phosphodiesterase (PDE) domain